MIPSNTKSQANSNYTPKEWYIVEKIPSVKGLAMGVFLFEEGMAIEHIAPHSENRRRPSPSK